MIDEALRRAALDALGGLGHPLAREALETGALDVIPDVARWEASHGTVRGDRVVVRVARALLDALLESPAAQDALAHGIGAAIGAIGERALYDLAFDVGSCERLGGGPYRGP